MIQIGGLNAQNFIKRVLARFFTNELATKYSWTGFRNNNKLENLEIIKIIKGSYSFCICIISYMSVYTVQCNIPSDNLQGCA